MSVSRRSFLRYGLGMVAVPAIVQQQDSVKPRLGGEGENGTLGDPTVVGRSRTPTSAKDNDAEIKGIEKQLRCTCGCTLDIYTCRTTDFTCTYSPALHREVVALHDEGKGAQQIIDAFVAKYGEQALMAPEAKGFNLAGYLVPGVVVAVFAGALAWVIRRRKDVALAAGTAAGASTTSAAVASPAELERLRRELSEVED